MIIYALEGLAGSLAGQGQAEVTAQLFGAVEAPRETLGPLGRTSRIAAELNERYHTMVRDQLDPAGLERARQQGRAMPLPAVIALAGVGES